ncbi:MAG: hypothetical protein JXB34_06685 [Bacteroidales bacterium]|nr:hypothetical protein [Bacteroidales bacterium]
MKTIRLIENYLEGTLGQQELEDFLKETENSGMFKAEVEFHKEVNDSIVDSSFELREQIQGLMPGNKKHTLRIISLLAPIAAIFIMALSLINITRQPQTDKVLKNYYNPYQTDLNTRSSNAFKEEHLKAYALYQENNFKASYELLKQLNSKKPGATNYASLLYFGLSALEIGRLDEAEASLKKVSSDSNSAYALHANWYLAMLHLKNNNPAEAEKYFEKLAAKENFYSNKAKRILKKHF